MERTIVAADACRARAGGDKFGGLQVQGQRASAGELPPRAKSARAFAADPTSVLMAQGDVHVRSLPAAPRPRTRSSALSPCPCDSQKNMMQALLGAGAMAEDDLLSKLEECIGLHQDAAKRAKLKFADNKDQDKATLDSVVSVLNTQLDPLGLKVCAPAGVGPCGRQAEGSK